MESAYGYIETRGLTASIEAADAMVKAAKVNIIKHQRIGGALVTVMIEGELAACQSAVAAGSAAAERLGELISAHVIPRPVDDVRLLFADVPAQGKISSKKSSNIEKTELSIKNSSKNSVKHKGTLPEPADESLKLLDWLATQKIGASLDQISKTIVMDNAATRRLVKQLMDEGCIEKVHQKYFFLSKRKNK